MPDADRELAALLCRVERLERSVEELRATKSVTQPPDPVADLKAACRELAIMVSWDGYVSEPGAALLLGKSQQTLRNWRNEHRPLPFRKLGGRIQYDLADLAAFLASEPPESA